MSARKGPVNVDDKENIDRFLKQMMRKNYEAAFTSSSSSIPPTTPGNTLQSGGSPPVSQPAHTKPQDTTVQGDGPSEATTPPNVQSAKIDKPQEQSALPPPPASTSSADTPVANQPGVNPNFTVNNTMRRSRGVSLNAGPNDTPASHQLPQWMEESCPPCQLSPTRTGAPHGLVDRFLQSPQMSGVQAPPPTPQTGPVSQHEITDIIHGAFDELQNAHPPAFTLGDSRYAPRRKSLLGQNRSDIRRSLEREGYTPFVTPNREISAEDRRMRDEAFERLRSQLSPQQGKLATTASVTVGGDGKNRIECLQLASPSKAGRPPHLRPYNPSPGINKDNIKPTLHVPISVSAPETAVGLTAPDFSQTAYRFDSSSEQDPDQQISKFQALKIGGQSTSTAKPTTSGETASPFSLHSSANLNSTRGDWMPPHLRPFTEEPVDKGSYQDGGGRSVVKKHDGVAPDSSAKREDGYSVAKATNTSESSSHNHEAPLPHFHMREPAITFTAETRNIAPDHEEPDSSLVNSDGHSSWQPGQAKSGFLAATSTPMDQATYTPAGSSTGSRTPPRFRPREEFAGSIAQRSRDNPHVKSAYSKESLKHGRPLKNNPVGATATTSSSVFAHGTSKVPLTVAMVDNSLSSLGDIFAPIPSAKLPTAVNSTHPLSALDNPFNATVSTPRSALETGVTTPSSMTFSAVSPATAAAAGITAAIREANEQPDLEDVLFFKSWPKSDGDRRPAARVRKVIITNLPPQSTANFVQSLVFGGPIEQINVGSTFASVVFVDAEHTKKYYDATANGLVYKKDGDKEHFVLVELAKDVDVVGGLLREMMEKSVTRCVKAIGVAEDWGMPALWKMAESKGRKVENIVEGVNAGGSRTITFRFCNMLDARAFLGVLQRDEEWEHCNIVFAADPCEKATGVHLD